MRKMIQATIGIGVLSCCLMFGTISCSIKDDYHQSNDEKWLIEQVEKGCLTQEQADAIRAQQKHPEE